MLGRPRAPMDGWPIQVADERFGFACAVGSYTGDARRLWRKRMRERGRGYLRASTVCVRETTPLLKMAVQGANMLAALSLGARIEMVEDLRETFRVLGVEPPPAGTPFPGRAAGRP